MILYRKFNGSYGADPGLRGRKRRHEFYGWSDEDYRERYFSKLRSRYDDIVTRTDLPEGQIKGIVYLLFRYLHEQATVMLGCPKFNPDNPSEEDPIVLLRNTYYTPERYGLRRENIDQALISLSSRLRTTNRMEDRNTIRTYVDRAMTEIHHDFCVLYGEDLPNVSFADDDEE